MNGLQKSISVRNKALSIVDEATGFSSEGIYYVLYTRNLRWKLYPIKCGDEHLHINMWRYEVLSFICEDWLGHLGKKAVSAAEKRLKNNYTGFPRGRVIRDESRKYVLLHGDDTPTPDIMRQIKLTYGIRNNVKYDEHETCSNEDKEAVRQALGISKNWPSI